MLHGKTLDNITPEEFTSEVFCLKTVRHLSDRWPQLNAAFVRDIITDYYHFTLDHEANTKVEQEQHFALFKEKVLPRFRNLGVSTRHARAALDHILHDARLEMTRLSRLEGMFAEAE